MKTTSTLNSTIRLLTQKSLKAIEIAISSLILLDRKMSNLKILRVLIATTKWMRIKISIDKVLRFITPTWMIIYQGFSEALALLIIHLIGCTQKFSIKANNRVRLLLMSKEKIQKVSLKYSFIRQQMKVRRTIIEQKLWSPNHHPMLRFKTQKLTAKIIMGICNYKSNKMRVRMMTFQDQEKALMTEF